MHRLYPRRCCCRRLRLKALAPLIATGNVPVDRDRDLAEGSSKARKVQAAAIMKTLPGVVASYYRSGDHHTLAGTNSMTPRERWWWRDLALDGKDRHAGGVRYAPLLVLAGLFIAVDVVVDRMVADSPGTLHHPRPLLLMLPALLLVAVLWRARDQVGTLGRVGVAMCTTGGVANMVCTLVDGDGVSDYIRFSVSHYLIVINLADILIVAGLVLVLVSTLAAYGGRLRRTVPDPPG
jgi:hypothetical protein